MTATVDLGTVLTGPQVRGFVIGLVAGVLASVGILLGAAFLVVGLASDDPDADALATVGAVALAVGVLGAIAGGAGAVAARRRARAEQEARTLRATAVVEDVRVREHSRIGNRNPAHLTVRFASAHGTQSHRRLVYVHPTPALRPGATIEVAYAPDDPANFVPVDAPRGT